MPESNLDFLCYDEGKNYRREAFPRDAIGVDAWTQAVAELQNARSADQAQRALETFQRNTALIPFPKPPCPRVFISHRHNDVQYALRMADRACRAGFNYWLDVFDPSLKALAVSAPSNFQQALAIGLIIEMALINCTHVLALITNNTPGSFWVPYEYGRVKDRSLPGLRPRSVWLHPQRSNPVIPEYMLLGERHQMEKEIDAWFVGELGTWRRKPPLGSSLSCPSKSFPYKTQPLP